MSKLLFVFTIIIIFQSFVAAQTIDKPFPVAFTDIAAQAGLKETTVYGGINTKKYIIETNGCGTAFFDYDNDGWTDIFVMSGTRLEGFPKGKEPTNRLYRNNKNGTFTDVTEKSNLKRTGWAASVAIGDYDNDGFEDLYLTYWGQNALYRNNGDGSFTDSTEKSKLKTDGIRWGSGATFVDYDRDGDLDLFVANYLKFDLAKVPEAGKGVSCVWKGIPVNCGPKGLPTDTNLFYENNGDGTFTDVSEKSGIAKVGGRYSMTAIVTDYNNDGFADIYVACDSTASTLYRNNKDKTFTDVSLESGTAYNEDGNSQAGMGVTIGDYDADGLPDIFKTHFADDLPVLYRNGGKDFFEDSSRLAGFDHTRYVQWGTGFADFDNDGWADILTVTGNVYPEIEKFFKEYPHRSPRLVYQNLGNGRFRDVSAQTGTGISEPKSSRGAALGDFDNDGDTDVLVMNMNEPPLLLRNDLKSANNWLTIKLIGTKSNRSAIGSRITIKNGTHIQTQEITSQTSYYSHNDFRQHFGLGINKQAETIEIRWASGAVETLKNVAGNQIIKIKEGSGVVK
jgi:enediyne biosynthesis protein E4